MRRRIAGFGAALSVIIAGACRDGVPPFTPPLRDEPDGDVLQLTFGTGDDRDPQWLPNNDTIIYHTDRFGALLHMPGALAQIARAGGVATVPLADVQALGQKLLATPAYSPDGARIAYVDLVRSSPVLSCALGNNVCQTPQPVLDSAVLRVRRVGETRGFDLDPLLGFAFDGVDPAMRLGLPGPYVQRVHPFHQLHRTENALLFRPSWSPDGQRVVFSDGLRLLLWQVGAAAAVMIPNTAEAVSAAWSPDGAWIAFTQLVRGDSTLVSCACTPPPQQHLRWAYEIAARRLVRVRPDGSDRAELGNGEDAAWSPDGTHIYARRDNVIVRLPAAGGTASAIANTAGGRSPAISRDGRWLAFSRRKTVHPFDLDLWVLRLAP